MNMRLLGLWTLVLCLGIGLFFVAWESYKHICLDCTLNAKMNEYATQQIDDAVQKISFRFQNYVQVARDAAQTLSSRTWDKDSLYRFLVSIVERQQDIQGVGIGFEPYKFNSSQRLYGVAAYRQNEKIAAVPINYDYTLPTEKAGARTDWYQTIKAREGWTEPYWGTAVQRHIIVYGISFFAPQDKEKKVPIGVLAIILRLDYVREIVNELALGKRSYGFVVSHKGAFVAHPIEELYRQGRTILDLAKDRKSKRLVQINQEILIKKSGKAPYVNEITGQPSMIFYRAIPGTNLMLGIIFIKEEFFAVQSNVAKHSNIKITFGIVLCLLLLLCLFLLMSKGSEFILVGATIVGSLILVGGISYLWLVQRTYGISENNERILVFDKNTIDKTVAACAIPARGIAAPDIIKTGILLKQIEHVTITQIYLAGRIWQKYPLKREASLVRGVFMPQCRRLFQKKLLFKEKNEKEEIYVWEFRGIFDQEPLIARQFPLDEQHINLILDHPSLGKNILLVPDLDSYKVTNPKSFPGISHVIKMLDWVLEKSFFSFKHVKHDVEVTAQRLDVIGKKYDLCFTVAAKRSLLGFLIMYLLSLLVALLLLFVSLCSLKHERLMHIISLTSGIFVGIILAHTALRHVLVGPIIFYLESFYVVSYFLVVLILINLLLYGRGYKLRFITYRDNLLAKVLFWPAFLFSMFLITSWMFW